MTLQKFITGFIEEKKKNERNKRKNIWKNNKRRIIFFSLLQLIVSFALSILFPFSFSFLICTSSIAVKLVTEQWTFGCRVQEFRLLLLYIFCFSCSFHYTHIKTKHIQSKALTIDTICHRQSPQMIQMYVYIKQ